VPVDDEVQFGGTFGYEASARGSCEVSRDKAKV
jgi:hypothetical protein